MSRLPPHNLQVEESLLGAMMLSKDAIGTATERLSAGCFYKPAHAHIFQAIVSLNELGEPADPATVADELRRVGLLEMVGGSAVLLGLQASTPATSNAPKYTAIIEELDLMRRLIGVGGEIAEIGYGQEQAEKALDRAESLVFDVSQRRSTDSMSQLSDILEGNLDELEARYERGDSLTGVPSGLYDLDDITGGFHDGALYVLGARPAVGKTSLALSIASHVAVHHMKPVMVFSLEMSRLEIGQRLLCGESRIDSKKLRTGQLTEPDWKAIAQATGRLHDAPLWVDENPNVTVMEIRSKARRMRLRHGDLALIVVDYIQLMAGEGENRQVAVSEISRGLKVLARELECPVLALSQLSRAVELRVDKRPMLSDLRESGALEQNADVVLLAYRDELYHEDSPDRGLAELNIAKHRNGPTGIVKLAFLGQYTKFANLARI